MALTVNELITKLGFQVDEAKLNRYNSMMGRAEIGSDRLERKTRGLETATRGYANANRMANQSILSMVSNVYLLVGAFTLLTAKAGFHIMAAGRFEQTQFAFETLVGSAEKGKAILADLFDFARTTPFTITGITDQAKLLLAYGIEFGNLMDRIKILGDISALLGPQAFPAVARALGQVKSAQRLRGQEELQFTNAGVGIIEGLAKFYGKTSEETRNMMRKGLISYEDVVETLRMMTSEGGRFFKAMERQSQTLFGLWSNILDFVQILSIEMGKMDLPKLKGLLRSLLAYMEANRKKIIEVGSALAEAVGQTLRDILLILRLVGMGFQTFIGAIGGTENAMKLLRIAMLALVGRGVLGLIMKLGRGVFTLGLILRTTGVRLAFLFGGLRGFISAGMRFGWTMRLITVQLGRFVTLVTSAIAAVGGFELLLGGLFFGLLLVVEDIVSYFLGKDSFTAKIVEFLKVIPNDFREMWEIIATDAKHFVDYIAGLFARLNPFGDMREKLFAYSGIADANASRSFVPSPITGSNTSNMQNNNVTVRIESPITINGASDPDATSTSIIDRLTNDFQSSLYRATLNNRPLVEY